MAETIAHFFALDGPTCEHRQPWRGVVAIHSSEGLEKLRRPIGAGTHFIAVEHQHFHRTIVLSTLLQDIKHVRDMRMGCIGTEVIDDQSARIRARAIQQLPRAMAHETQNAPSPRGNTPRQSTICRQIRIEPQRFLPICDRFVRRIRQRKHSNILIVLARQFRHGQNF